VAFTPRAAPVEPGLEQQRLDPALVERIERRLRPAHAPAAGSDAGSQAVERIALQLLLVLDDELGQRVAGLVVARARKIHAPPPRRGVAFPPAAGMRLEPWDGLHRPAHRHAVEPLGAPPLVDAIGHTAEMVIGVLLDAPLVPGLRPAALVVLSVHVVVE